MKDNLFDGKFTFLDVVKIALLVVTAFSTWNVVDLMTPDTSMAFVRKTAAVIVVEGAFIGFEYATAKAKSRKQTAWATVGFFCSLVVITLFAGTSGLLEFGGTDLMTQYAGNWLGLNWLVSDAVQATALLVLVLWIAVLASIYRVYTLNDPDKIAELDDIELNEEINTEANAARRVANRKTAPVVASHRTLADIQSRYGKEINAEMMKSLLGEVSETLKEKYSINPTHPPQPTPTHTHTDEAIAVDPQTGFVPRVPPYEAKTTNIFRGTPIYFESAIKTKGDGVTLEIGTPLQAILCEDGKYNISEQDQTYAFARVTAEELGILQGDAIKEDRPAQGTDFQV